MSTIHISLDSKAIATRFAAFSGKLNTLKKRMLEEAGQIAVDEVRGAIGAVGIKRRSGNLLDSVDYNILSDDSAEVFIDEDKSPYADYLNIGYSPFSMKTGLLGSAKAKISKAGYRYIRVPMDGKILTISENPRMTKKGTLAKRQSQWHHPGYSGRLFWKVAMERAEYRIIAMVNERLTELEI